MWFEIAGVMLAYVIGSIPFGYLVARARGVDILKLGSGNIGATNVGRTLGRKFGILVFVLDFLKGALPTGAMLAWTAAPNWGVAAGLAAVVGHMFPVFLRFRGGKGVATGFGVVAVIMPAASAIALLVWLAVLSSTRTMSAASVLAALVLAATRIATTAEPFGDRERIVTAFSVLVAVLVVVRHRTNLGRIMQGNERKVTDSAKLQTIARVLHVVSLGLWFGGGVMFSFIVAPSLFATFDSAQAGRAVAPIFPIYFALQGTCGLIALTAAVGWAAQGGIHRMRFIVLLIALILVLIGWPLSGHVSTLRTARNSADPVIARLARESFANWHLASLFVNMTVLGLAGFALGLSAVLPERLPRIADEHCSL